jgi:hypothetical protein
MKSLLTILAIAGLQLASYSQACTPNNDTISGIEPDTLAVAVEGESYSETIYFRMPADTLVEFIFYNDTLELVLCIDSLVIDSVAGLPPGFSFACNNATCMVPGGGNGCLLLTGSPQPGQAGIYPFLVFVTVFVDDCISFTFPPQVDTVTTYYLEIAENTSATVIHSESYSLIVSPNPCTGNCMVEATVTEPGRYQFQVFDVQGNLRHSQEVNLSPGKNILTIPEAEASTAFILKLTGNESSMKQKFLVVR